MSHASSLIAGLRSVALNVPDLAFAEEFFTDVWRLDIAHRRPGVIYLCGTGEDDHLLALHEKPGPAQIRHVSLRARHAQALNTIAQSAVRHGGRVVQSPGEAADPSGGIAVQVADADGRVFEIVHGDRLRAQPTRVADRPERLAHAVLNTHDVALTQAFMENVLDFSLSDRTRIMAFMRCNSDHHSVALGISDNDALNHIAFLMPDLESVMRGGGRMRDAGYDIHWGPGRHGPGNNAFNYFIGPFDIVIEYTAEVSQIDDSYPVGQPDNWTWPPGRVDHWGISAPPSARLKEAQRAILFAA